MGTDSRNKIIEVYVSLEDILMLSEKFRELYDSISENNITIREEELGDSISDSIGVFNLDL